MHSSAVAIKNVGLALLALGLWIVPGTAAARDRPGTPSGISAYVCAPQDPLFLPRLCLEFFNTADEEVNFEFDTTRAGQPIPPPAARSCISIPADPSMCPLTFRGAHGLQGKGKVASDFRELQFDTEYCFRVRTRRTNDSVVSELWTAWSCARTPRQPAAPSKPRVDVEFVTRNPASGGTSDRADHVIVTTSEGGNANLSTTVTGLGQYTYVRPQASNVYDWSIEPNDDHRKITACASNYSGDACTIVEASVLQKVVLSDDSRPPPPKAPPAPDRSQEIYDRDPTGKGIEQCNAAYNRNLNRCVPIGPSCNAEVEQIMRMCMGQAQATAAEVAADRDPTGKGVEQCNAAYNRNRNRCGPTGLGPTGLSCNAEIEQIMRTCMGQAQAAP